MTMRMTAIHHSYQGRTSCGLLGDGRPSVTTISYVNCLACLLGIEQSVESARTLRKTVLLSDAHEHAEAHCPVGAIYSVDLVLSDLLWHALIKYSDGTSTRIAY